MREARHEHVIAALVQVASDAFELRGLALMPWSRSAERSCGAACTYAIVRPDLGDARMVASDKPLETVEKR